MDAGEGQFVGGCGSAVVDAGRAEQFERAGSAAALWQWTHLAAVHDTVAGTVSLYVNGILQGSVAAPSTW
ncbi:hypothetical protein EYS09_14515 [Streptomyces kasugaensis]|uniref:LamG domain-containing protein n=1 Tax=Streptomyces kasugaensis TaxID=1946 RepID=A0A4Q9HVN6_STRKA|nr:hypothetical protein EYS09_14515 [Streptomyces kasugaensis]